MATNVASGLFVTNDRSQTQNISTTDTHILKLIVLNMRLVNPPSVTKPQEYSETMFRLPDMNYECQCMCARLHYNYINISHAAVTVACVKVNEQ